MRDIVLPAIVIFLLVPIPGEAMFFKKDSKMFYTGKKSSDNIRDTNHKRFNSLNFKSLIPSSNKKTQIPDNLKNVPTEELQLLTPYNTPEKIFNFTIKLQGKEKLVKGEDIFPSNYTSYPGYETFTSNYSWSIRKISEIVNKGNATSEEVSIIQFIALRLAGYKARLVTLPTEVKEGMRKIMFAAYYDEKNMSWRAIGNKKLMEVEDSNLKFDKKGVSIPTNRIDKVRKLGFYIDNNSIVYSINPKFYIPNNSDKVRYEYDKLTIELAKNFKNICQEHDISFNNKQLDSWIESQSKTNIIQTFQRFQMLPKKSIVENFRIILGKSDTLTALLTGKKGYSNYNPFNNTLYLNQSNNINHELMHILHLQHFHSKLLGNCPPREGIFWFVPDKNFVDVFYEPTMGQKIFFQLLPGNVLLEAETFAEMGDMYVTDPHILREWIINRLSNFTNKKELNKALRSVKNYLYLKTEVFNGQEYGNLEHSRIWCEKSNHNLKIHYVSKGKPGVTVIIDYF